VKREDRVREAGSPGVLGLSTGGSIVGWVVAVIGAALLVFILKAVGVFK
jgi:hypothetical protein